MRLVLDTNVVASVHISDSKMHEVNVLDRG
jgi:predicted nucleic acid-binding protein